MSSRSISDYLCVQRNGNREGAPCALALNRLDASLPSPDIEAAGYQQPRGLSNVKGIR
jgi:hypothetical protein